MCNGHADTCHVHEPSPTRILACQCQHDTCGIQCNECCPGFEQKKWRQNTKSNPFKCERNALANGCDELAFNNKICSLQHATASVIPGNVSTTNRPINKGCHWIWQVSMRVVAFVKNANTIPKASTAINANRSIIDRMESAGMKRMCVNVSYMGQKCVSDD